MKYLVCISAAVAALALAKAEDRTGRLPHGSPTGRETACRWSCLTERALDVRLACNRAIHAAGLNGGEIPRGKPTETHNLNALFTMASGALALTLECSVSWPSCQLDPSKAPSPYTFDQLIEPVFIVLRTMLAEGLKSPFVVRGTERILDD